MCGYVICHTIIKNNVHYGEEYCEKRKVYFTGTYIDVV